MSDMAHDVVEPNTELWHSGTHIALSREEAERVLRLAQETHRILLRNSFYPLRKRNAAAIKSLEEALK